MKPDEFKKLGYALIDWLADYRQNIDSEKVWNSRAPGTVRAALPDHAPEEPESSDALLQDLENIIKPGLSHWQHPKFFGYFPANSELSAVLGDLVSSGLGQLGLNWQASPALTELEEQMMDWMRQLCGLSPAWRGVIQDTASTGTMVALMSARELSTHYGSSRDGLQGEQKPLTIYVTQQAHSSVEKGALLAGFGKNNLRLVPMNEHFEMLPDALDQMIEQDIAAGCTPCAVVASLGSTSVAAFDPVAKIAHVANLHGLWLHVDAAMAGSAMLLPECRHLFDGLEQADSLAMNPHKWLGASFDCSLYFVRNPEHLVRVMSTNPSYLQTSNDAKTTQFRDWGVPLGRRMRALKLWFLLRLEGAKNIRARLRRDLENAQWLASEVQATPNWQVLAPVRLQTVCVRHVPAGVDDAALDVHTRAWCDAINQSGEAYLTPSVLDGRWMVRVSIGALGTTQDDVRELWQSMQRFANSR